MVVCLAIQLRLGCEPESEAMNRYRYNFMGGMLPFGLGILYARYGEKISDDFPSQRNQLLWHHLLQLHHLQSQRKHDGLDLRASLHLSAQRT